MQMEGGVLYFCPPTDGKEVHLEHDEFNKVNYGSRYTPAFTGVTAEPNFLTFRSA